MCFLGHRHGAGAFFLSKGENMSGKVGYENVKMAVKNSCDTIASGIKLVKSGLNIWKNKDKIMEEIVDTQVDEVIDLAATELRQGIATIFDAIKS